ncbi:BAH and coiled-coil domain-containing protein 1 isoform X2 [Astyanax mexicanus]|uniref:BAH and coiled-coil domain-containing protein 1 isoform X2 n=1 Tax=Astyanax mexicanus TaxID=7994 RepID=UPI0020CB34D1|nr:BAH and coiled-coil domain-containing protein 1 isoform X2 [Astyanax mexicanus]
MEGREFAAPAHLLSERGALVHRAASRISSSGHGSVQHAGPFPPGKYYPSPHLPMPTHSGSGLMGNSSASFMGTFLASSLGSPPSHPPHPSRPPSSPSSPPYRGGPHSSASQIWFPHSHEAAPGYPRFSGSLAHTFLPISHLDHHANSGVLYGQHRFYDTQKENFYLRSLPSQPPLISANHGIPPMSRTGPGHPQGSCSRDAGGGMNLHKGLKDAGIDRGVVSGTKDNKERPSSKQEAKDRHAHNHHPQPQQQQQHHHPQQLAQHHAQHPITMEDVNGRALERHKASVLMEYKDHSHSSMSKPLSACLMNGKMQNGDSGGGVGVGVGAGAGSGSKGPMVSCGAEGMGRSAGSSASVQPRHMGNGNTGRCTKEAASGEMRISEQPPSDCLERSQALHQSLTYSVPPPLPMGSAAGGGHPHPGGFHCLQLHPSHPHHPHHTHHHHPHHHSHHSHHHPDFFCPPPPAPVVNPSLHDKGSGVQRDPKVTGPTFVPSVGHLGEKVGAGPFQLGHPECQGSGSKDKAMEKASGGGGGHAGNWHRKQQEQQQQQQQQPPPQKQHPYRKAEKAPDWMHNNHHHLQQQQQQQQQQQSHAQQHQAVRSRSADCINSMDSTDVYRPAPVQEPKSGHPLTHPNGVNPQSYRDCSHTGPPPNSSPLAGKTMAQQGPGGGASCSMQRDGQKVARIRHQQHGRAGSDASSTDLNQGNGNQEMKRKMEMSPYGYGGNSGQHHSHQQPPVPPWVMHPHHVYPEEDQRKAYMESIGGPANGRQQPQPQPQQQQQPQHQSAGMGPPGPPGPPLPAHPAPAQTQQESLGPQGEGSAMKNLLKYSNQQQPLLLSQKSPFGGLGSLKTAHNNNTNCTLQAGKPTLPSRKGPTNESERPDCGGRSRDIGEAPHVEGEVRQPPVGIAVAVARQRDPTCRPPDNHPSSRQGRVHSAMKGAPRSMYPPESPGEEERKRMSGEHIGHPCLDRERDTFIRDNKERVEFARIHPSNSCHGDLPSHIMVPGGNSLQSGQLGDPAAHAHSAHHHWMPRTGSPSLWMTGHSYGISHTALHQNLPPGFSAAMPAPLQPVLPLPQDPSAQLVVLPSEPASHPATHHLDVMEQPGLWPPVYRARGPPSHMQHPAVYSRSQFLRQQELYALQQHQQLQQQQQHPGHQQPPQTPQQHRGAPHSAELQHRNSHSQMQKKSEEQSMELEDILSEPRTPKPAKSYAYGPAPQASPPPRASALHLSPCCQSPCIHPHPKSTASTPCPAASPAATAARSPAISPAPPQLPKAAESQDKRAEGQPPQDYPQTMEPDLPPEYTYPAITMGYRGGPSPQDVRLAEPAELETIPVEPVEHAPPPLSSLGEELGECHAIVRPITESQLPMEEKREEDLADAGQGAGMLAPTGQPDPVDGVSCCVPAGDEVEEGDDDEDDAMQVQDQATMLLCPPAEASIFEVAPCPIAPIEKQETQRDECIMSSQEDVSEVLPEQDNDQGVPEVPEVDAQNVPDPERPCVPDLSAELQTEVVQPLEETATAKVREKEDQEDDKDVKILSSCPSPVHATSCPQPLVPSYWSLELLIAAAFCGDCPPPSPPPSTPPQDCSAQLHPSTHGMELLSEVADLELQHHRHSAANSEGEEQLIFDLQSLATLAAARALEFGAKANSLAESEKQNPGRRILNLRRKCTWTPRHEPVCPVKGSMEAMDGQELAMRVRLAELQRRYKEKQKELAKLQRKHDHQKEETPRSPARRGPGRPRKRKSTPGLGPAAPPETQKKVKSVGAVLSLLVDESGGGRGGGGSGDSAKKRKLSNRGFSRLGAAQMKMQCCQKSSLHEHHVEQLKPKTSTNRTGIRHRDASACSSAPSHLYLPQRSPKAESRLPNESEGQSDTGSGDSAVQDSWKGRGEMTIRKGKRKSGTVLNRASTRLQPRSRILRARGQEVTEDGDTSALETESSEQEEEEDEGSENSDEGQTAKSPASRELPSSSAVKDPSPSSVVKLEANQKAKNKRERQELYGLQHHSGAEGEVKVKKKAPCRSAPVTASKPPGVRRRPGRPRLQEKPWTGHYHKPPGLLSFTTTSERLRRATRKSSILRGAVSKRKSWSGVAQSSQSDDNDGKRRTRFRQSKGRAVSRLLESFAADEGFRLGEDSSFSDEDEEGNSSSRSRTPPAPPNCVLSKDQLTDGLRVLICKEDELLYAARVRTVDVPDIYSIVIDGERGNRPRIYSLEQLLQEAVLEVRPETEAVLTEGTRVCAYWSERSRCLYPGYVRRGGASDECKPGGVMVEFDDGDRGRISLHNIRFLPPGYQVQCAESSPTPDSTNRSLSDKMGSAHDGKNSQINKSSEKTPSTEDAKALEKPVRRPGRPKGSGLKRFISDGAAKNSTSPLTWPSVDVPRKRAPVNLFQLNGSAPKKALRNREAAMFPHPPVSMTTPAKGIFSSSSFEVDSFSSIANGYSSFCSQTLPSTGMPLGGRSSPYGGRRRSEDPDVPRGRKNEFLIKLDHEGVTSPKNKSSKALLLLGGSGFGPKGLGSAPPRSEAYSHPVLLVKDSRKGDSSRAELLPIQRKPSSSSSSLRMGEYGDLGLSCHRDCHSSYSGMDEEEDEEEEDRRRRGGGTTMLPSASGSIRTADRFLSRLSVSSSSSGSSSSSSSGSLSSSSLCSSDNDSSYSSEDEESSTLLLQSCLTPHRSILQPPNPKPPSGPSQHTFVAKAVALPNAKSANANHSAGSKPLKRKECTGSPSKPSKDLVKRQKMLPDQSRPKASSSFLPARQLWRWSGSPTQRRGLKGKARKLFYKAVVRGRDMVRVGDCAVFLSTGRPQLPYVGRIESFWESWSSSMVVKVKWFYHPEETKLGKSHRDGKHALYQSCHEDENDVQTISHKCQVVSREEYERVSRNRKPGSCLQDLYYLAGTYDPTSGQLLTADGVSIHC